MKYVDEGTIGGRIRLSRQKLNLSLSALAKNIGVSANYVSVVERNVKSPSDKLLSKIAEAVGVSEDWLKNGDDSLEDDTSGKADFPQRPIHIESIDAQLFLNLIMCSNPTISEDTIATVLAIEHESLKDILNGTIKYDPAWESGFIALAQRIEIPTILSKLHAIESFFGRVETKKVDFSLIRCIGTFLSEMFSDEFTYFSQSYTPHGPDTYIDIRKSNINTGIPVRHFIFKQESTDHKWNVMVFSQLYGSMLEEVLNRAIFPRNSNSTGTVIMLSEEDNFNYLLEVQKDVLRWGPSSLQNQFPVIAMLIDLDSMTITKCNVICDSSRNDI